MPVGSDGGMDAAITSSISVGVTDDMQYCHSMLQFYKTANMSLLPRVFIARTKWALALEYY
jgi:hypothetical protein